MHSKRKQITRKRERDKDRDRRRRKEEKNKKTKNERATLYQRSVSGSATLSGFRLTLRGATPSKSERHREGRKYKHFHECLVLQVQHFPEFDST